MTISKIEKEQIAARFEKYTRAQDQLEWADQKLNFLLAYPSENPEDANERAAYLMNLRDEALINLL
jgi:hypothetical protein